MTTALAEPAGFKFDLGLIANAAGEYPQEDFYHGAGDYELYYGGVGIGKSLVVVADAFRYAYDWPGSRQLVSEPTFPMIRDILYPTIDELYGPHEGIRFELVRSPPPEVRFPNGSLIYLRSTGTNPDRLRGTNLARVLMDEVTLGSQEDAHNILDARLRQKMPSGDFYPTSLKATGTPKGRDWVFRDYVDRPLPGTTTYYAATLDAVRAGTLPPDFVARLVRKYGEGSPLARQELEGAFLRMAGPVFAQFDRHKHVKAYVGEPLKDVLGGIDPGGVSPTALIVAGLHGTGRGHAIAEWYKAEAGLDQTVAAMADLENETGVREWLIDPSATEWMQKLNNAGFRVRKARHGNDIKLRVQLVSARLNLAGGEPGLWMSHACPNLISEIEGLMWYRSRVPGRAEEIRKDRFEQGTPDHAFDALTNIVAEWDGTREPTPRIGPIEVWREG